MIFVTGNKHKFEEACKIIPDLEMVSLDVPELQLDKVEDIAAESIKPAFAELGKPCFVEDTGLFVHALGNFPGPYARHALESIGCEGLIKLMQGVEDRGAHYITCIAYADDQGVKTFVGRDDGNIALESLGDQGFGFDKIFISQGYDKTSGEQDMDEKNKHSPRAKAMQKFKQYLYKEKMAE